MAAVFQSERFFREAWPQISQAFASPTDAASDVEWIVGVAALEAGARILDAPCGFGRHSIELRSEEHTSELQSRSDLVCRLLLEKKKNNSILVMCARCEQ